MYRNTSTAAHSTVQNDTVQQQQQHRYFTVVLCQRGMYLKQYVHIIHTSPTRRQSTPIHTLSPSSDTNLSSSISHIPSCLNVVVLQNPLFVRTLVCLRRGVTIWPVLFQADVDVGVSCFCARPKNRQPLLLRRRPLFSLAEPFASCTLMAMACFCCCH